MQHIMAIDAIIVEDMKTNEYFVQFSVYFQRVIPSEKVEIVSTLYFNTAKEFTGYATINKDALHFQRLDYPQRSPASSS